MGVGVGLWVEKGVVWGESCPIFTVVLIMGGVVMCWLGAGKVPNVRVSLMRNAESVWCC